MCTITLSYDPNNEVAIRQLTDLLNTGQFVTDEETKQRLHITDIYSSEQDDPIDYSDPWLYEEHSDLPSVSEEVRDLLTADPNGTMSIEKALDITLKAVEYEYSLP
ncbi:MAG: hypothetical protein IJQ60_17355 [Prevotella sp.]|nr:hypothetical protein [Prevotella sp.]